MILTLFTLNRSIGLFRSLALYKDNFSEKNIYVVIGTGFINNSFHFWAKCFACISLLKTHKNLLQSESLS